MIRELYHTLSNFTVKIRDLIQYRIAIQNLKTKYPSATVQELEQTDKVCIICREEMAVTQGEEVQRATPKKLNCGHIFHFKCLKSWLERQQSCPTCRTSLLQGIFHQF
jgi:E3 ubiquitin-protein ligase synoviolin